MSRCEVDEAGMRAHDLPCPAPDRAPRGPQVPFPFGACDTHAHLCGPAHTFPYAEERIYTPPDSTAEHYLDLLTALGIGRAVLIQPSVYGTDNRALVDALGKHRQGLRGVAVVDPDITDDRIRALHGLGIRGLRLNVVDHAGVRNVVPIDTVRKVAAAVAPYGWHIEFLINLDEASGFGEFVRSLPVDVVASHLGYPRMGAAPWLADPSFVSLLRLFESGRCWVKLTGPYRISAAPDLPYDDVVPLARRLAEINPDRLLWGTDWPHVMNKKPMPNDGDLCDLHTDWLPHASLRERVLVTNPAALYGFSKEERLPAS
jgi:2-pyrone-4,6-dicarboxylate lactonase